MYKIYTRQPGTGNRLYPKIWLIMRLTTLILIASLVQVSAASFGQRITLNQQRASLKTILKEIRKQSGYDVFCENKLIPEQPLTVRVTNVTVEEALNVALDGLDLKYQIEGRTISITKKTFIENVIDRFQTIDVQGRVLDHNGEPLPGVVVRVKDGTIGTVTDKDGRFVLKALDENTLIVFSFIGYKTIEMRVIANLGDLRLDLNESRLDEVQIQAYGATSKRLNTGNISTVKAKDIQNVLTSNPLLAIQGRVPGVFIQQTSGNAGAGVNIRIQGQNSLQSGNEPLYVVDGVPFTSQLLPLLGGPGLAGGSPLNFINPQDIESIDILKDADATSIYGSRAANGAVVITTKKGTSGKSTVNVTVQQGYSEVASKLKLLNTQQYLELRREAKKNDNVAVASRDYDLNSWDQNRYTDWQEYFLGNTAKYTDAQLSLSGGSGLTNFMLNGGLHRETNLLPGKFEDKKGSLRAMINHNSSDHRFSLNFSTSYMYDDNQLPNEDLTARAMILAPNAPDPLKADGTINWQQNSAGTSTFKDNPLIYLNNKYFAKTNNLISSLSLGYEITAGVNIKSNFGYTNLKYNENIIYPISSSPPESIQVLGNSLRSAQYGSSEIGSWIVEPQLSFRRFVGVGVLDLLLGGTLNSRISSGFQATGNTYISDDLLLDMRSASNFVINNTTSLKYRYIAGFTRLNYNVKDKYLVSLNARRDGTSRFGDNNKFQNFGSIGMAWIFTKESFFEKTLPTLSFGKLRFSYGTTGNDQINDYKYLNLYTSITSDAPYQGIIGQIPDGLSNPYIQWESTKKMQIGTDLGFFNDRLLISLNYFDNRSANQLIAYSLSSFAGFGNIITNFPAKIQNKGYEISITSENLKANSFAWTTTLNTTIYRNRLLAFDGLENSSYRYDLKIGESINSIPVYQYSKVNTQTGLYEVIGADGMATSSPNSLTDKILRVNKDPKFYAGLQNSIRYKRLRFDFLVEFVKQLGETNFIGSFPGFRITNQPISVLERWQRPGDEKPVQRYFASNSRAVTAQGAYRASDASWVDASYLRLKNLSVSYDMTGLLSPRLSIRSARLTLNAQNLFTLTKYPQLDPETKSSSVLPTLRTVAVGLQVTS